jgi:hypothetical protein
MEIKRVLAREHWRLACDRLASTEPVAATRSLEADGGQIEDRIHDNAPDPRGDECP